MSRWTTKAGCTTTVTRTYTPTIDAYTGPRVWAEITAADGVLYWIVLADGPANRRGVTGTECIARGIWADVPTARAALKAKVSRIGGKAARAEVDHAIARAIEAMNVAIAEAEAAASAADDLDLADTPALKAWDRENTRAKVRAEATAARLDALLALAA